LQKSATFGFVIASASVEGLFLPAFAEPHRGKEFDPRKQYSSLNKCQKSVDIKKD
jgi:hypothetical protein